VACGMGGAISAVSVAYSLLIIFGISLIAVLSMRAAAGAFGRMRLRHPSRGSLKVAQFITTVLYAASVASTIVSGGLALALVLLM